MGDCGCGKGADRAGTGGSPSPTARALTDPTSAYHAAVAAVRAQGCRCALMWKDGAVVPFTGGDAKRCGVHGAPRG